MSARRWIDTRTAYLLVVCRPFLEAPKAHAARAIAKSTAAAYARTHGADAARWPGATS